MEYKETQKFSQWWFWLSIVLLFLMGIAVVVLKYFFNYSIGNREYSLLSSILTALFLFILSILLLTIKLTFKINENGISYSFFPFLKKTIKWNKIKSYKIVNYGYIAGYGIRFDSKLNMILNIKGPNGVLIELVNNKKITIGTNNITELQNFIKKAKFI